MTQFLGMSTTSRDLLLWCAVMSASLGVGFGAQGCEKLLSSSKGLTTCQTLPKLGSTLAWAIHNATNTVDFAFSGLPPSSGGWVAWGINPTSQAMVGTQALIAFPNAGVAVVHTYSITSAMKRGAAPMVPGNVTLNFTKVSAEITAGGITTVFVTLTLKPKESRTLNHVWNQGSSVDLATNGVGPHAMAGDSVASVAAIDLVTNVATEDVDLPHQKLKHRHGIISAVTWGLLLPLGTMAARYLRPLSDSNPAWFYIHVTCQSSGYLLGVVGWAMGLQLHEYIVDEGAAVPTKHRSVGITIFTFSSLQMLALWLRPKPDDKYRTHWNVYHHALGYATVVLIIVNIFEGLHLLQPGEKWTNAYTVVLTVLGGTSFFMEIIVWNMWLHQRAKKNAGSGSSSSSSSRAKDKNGNATAGHSYRYRPTMDAI